MHIWSLAKGQFEKHVLGDSGALLHTLAPCDKHGFT